MYTQNDFPVGSKARVIATGEVFVIESNEGEKLLGRDINKNILFLSYSHCEPVFEYGDDVEYRNGYVMYISKVPENSKSYKRGLRHIILSKKDCEIVFINGNPRRASSRKSELLKQLEQAREEERQATKKREELEKELETIK